MTSKAQTYVRGFVQAPKRAAVALTCKGCEKAFTVKYSVAFNRHGEKTRMYCSAPCASKHKNPIPMFECKTCRKITVRTKCVKNGHYNYEQKHCSKACGYIAMNKGGYIEKSGYRIIHIAGKAIPEHRHVMEKNIGRKLHRDETVHHLNGLRADNRIENLELWSSRQVPGQRVCDKVSHAREMLERYAVPVSAFTVSEAMCGLTGCV